MEKVAQNTKQNQNDTKATDGGIRIHVAESAGVCFGVERAVQLSEKALAEQTGPISSLGPLIHNPQTVEQLRKRGLTQVDEISQVTGTVVFRSHGVTVQVQRQAEEKGLQIVDATCPLVKVPQKIAKKMSEAGLFVVIVGDKNHPEIQGVKSYVTNGEVAVIKGPDEVGALPQKERVGVICQTTLKKSIFLEVVEKCQARFSEVKAQNTICSATKDRQEAALKLSHDSDCVVVIGGRHSSNTQKLYDICNDITHNAHLIESEDELEPSWFSGCKSIGITAGASTPHWLIDKVRERISALTLNT